MFLYFYGNLSGLSKNPSEKQQSYIRLQQKYYQWLSLIPQMFDNEGNIINLPRKGGLMEQDYFEMQIVLQIKNSYVEYLNSKQ